MSVPRYPLAWPAGWPRGKPTGGLRSGSFTVNYDKALRDLGYAIEKLGGRYPIVSSNLELRIDGMPRRDKGEPLDRGVAVYFELKGQQKVFACDTFTSVKANLRAIGLTIAALRSIELYGATVMLDRALHAFDALPAPKSCWEILELPPGSAADAIERAFKELAFKHHPDRGGSNAKMAEINGARQKALKESAE